MHTHASYACCIVCSRGGEAPITAASALVLPVTLLAFLRPMPLPYSWAAAPEALSSYDAAIAITLVVGLFMYHGASLAGALQAKSLVHLLFPGVERGAAVEGRQRKDVSPTELVGPSLHL